MRDDRLPEGFGLGTGAVVVLGAVLLCAALPPAWWFGVLPAVVAGCSAFLRPREALAVAGVAFLLADGFLVGSEGDLVWHGQGDLLRAGLLAAAAGAGAACGVVRAHRWPEAARRAWEQFVNRVRHLVPAHR